MSKITIGIDASRNRSGGAIDHIIGFLSAVNPLNHGIQKVHIWTYNSLGKKIPDFPWLVKHCPLELEGTISTQMWWQYYRLPRELRRYKCDILFASDAGNVCLFNPMVVFSQDAQSYEPGIIKYYGLSLARLRLILLYYIQNRSLKYSDGVIFLTKYAADLIQGSTGALKRFTIIPHGVDQIFHQANPQENWPENTNTPIRCIYVSNVAMYKNQWFVVRAVKKLRSLGYNIEIILVGGGAGSAKRLLDKEIAFSDPHKIFVRQMGFVKHNELPDLLASTNIFIFASSCETISITLLEGMAIGLPIACANRGPMPEVLSDGGVYFDPEDSDSIASTVESIIKDEKLRSSISKKAKELSRQYTWERCATETWDFLRTIAEG